MEYFKIQLAGEQFVRAYLIYIVELVNEKYGTYYYIGQTGDRNHVTARPAFRRLSAHLNDQGYSSENQLYRAIVSQILNKDCIRGKAFDKNIKDSVSAFLCQSTVNMHVFPIRQFDAKTAHLNHANDRKFVEQIEDCVIENLISKVGRERVLNKRLLAKNDLGNAEVSEFVERIVKTACP